MKHFLFFLCITLGLLLQVAEGDVNLPPAVADLYSNNSPGSIVRRLRVSTHINGGSRTTSIGILTDTATNAQLLRERLTARGVPNSSESESPHSLQIFVDISSAHLDRVDATIEELNRFPPYEPAEFLEQLRTIVREELTLSTPRFQGIDLALQLLKGPAALADECDERDISPSAKKFCKFALHALADRPCNDPGLRLNLRSGSSGQNPECRSLKESMHFTTLDQCRLYSARIFHGSPYKGMGMAQCNGLLQLRRNRCQTEQWIENIPGTTTNRIDFAICDAFRRGIEGENCAAISEVVQHPVLPAMLRGYCEAAKIAPIPIPPIEHQQGRVAAIDPCHQQPLALPITPQLAASGIEALQIAERAEAVAPPAKEPGPKITVGELFNDLLIADEWEVQGEKWDVKGTYPLIELTRRGAGRSILANLRRPGGHENDQLYQPHDKPVVLTEETAWYFGSVGGNLPKDGTVLGYRYDFFPGSVIDTRIYTDPDLPRPRSFFLTKIVPADIGRDFALSDAESKKIRDDLAGKLESTSGSSRVTQPERAGQGRFEPGRAQSGSRIHAPVESAIIAQMTEQQRRVYGRLLAEGTSTGLYLSLVGADIQRRSEGGGGAPAGIDEAGTATSFQVPPTISYTSQSRTHGDRYPDAMERDTMRGNLRRLDESIDYRQFFWSSSAEAPPSLYFHDVHEQPHPAQVRMEFQNLIYQDPRIDELRDRFERNQRRRLRPDVPDLLLREPITDEEVEEFLRERIPANSRHNITPNVRQRVRQYLAERLFLLRRPGAADGADPLPRPTGNWWLQGPAGFRYNENNNPQ